MPFTTTDRLVRTIKKQLVAVVVLLQLASIVNSNPVCVNIATGKKCAVYIAEEVPDDTLVFKTVDYISGGFLFSNTPGGQNISFDNYFTKDSNGEIRTKGTFDRELMVNRETAPYPVQVVHNIYSNANDYIELTIHVVDLNDNVPRFKMGLNYLGDNYTEEIYESLNPVPSTILTLEAVDYDEGPNGTASVKLIEPGVQMFNMSIENISSRPSIIKIKPLLALDREYRDNYTFQLIASEGTANPVVTTVNVSIVVKDIDDNSPMFEMPEYYRNISEQSPINTSVVTVLASDADIGTNAEVGYSIREICSKSSESAPCLNLAEPSWPFALDTESGLLTITDMLNYEDVVEYTVTVDATNPHVSKGGSSTALVRVEILDVNDNAPQVYDFSIGDFSEGSAVGSLYTTFRVKDADSPPFSKFHLSLLDAATLINTTVFGIETDSQLFRIVSLSKVDRETKDHYDLILKAVDSLNPNLFNTYNFTINIRDENDHSPMFNEISNPVFIDENSPSSTFVVNVSATDLDTGSNAAIHYSLYPQSNSFPYQTNFSIQTITGKILVVDSNLDRETTPNLFLLVQAIDNNGAGRATNLTLNITLVDVNDNPPHFISTIPSNVYINENSAIGTPVINVNATDPDEGSNAQLTYSLILVSPVGINFPFLIDSSTGIVSTNGTIDRESTSEYSVRVSVSDGHNHPIHENFTISVLDLNDNNPVFNPTSYYGTLHENATIGTTAVTLSATDIDTVQYTDLTYTFVTGDPDFQLDSSTGVIKTARLLNWEIKSQYTLVVRVSDGHGRQSTVDATVNITVVDINDEIPQFVGAPFVFYILEESAVNSSVGNVTVKSIEQGANGKAQFNIDTNGVPFQIDQSTGTITTTTSLDRESKDSYVMTVRVSDVAPPSHYNTTTVTILVSDVNDNAPIFDEIVVPLDLSENQPVNNPFYTARAHDSDIYPNNVTKYSLTKESSQFQINSDTGELSLVTSLNYEVEQFILIEVTARDLTLFNATQQINITVIDDNNTNITFPENFPLQVQVYEDTPINYIILNFTGQDNKGNPKLHLNYYLTNQSGSTPTQFGIEVEPTTGYALLTIADHLDRETTASHKLNITITDHSTPPSIVTQFLTVHLLDINDNSPKFFFTPYMFTIEEEREGKVELGRVTAKDTDAGANGTVTYTLQNTHSNLFSVDSETGHVYQESSLDRETTDAYDLVVIASDQGSPPKTSQTNVHISISDINDNYPSFSPWLVEVEENIKVGTVVVNLVGHDADIGTNGQVMFIATQNSNATSHFQLLPNGTIRVLQVPDYEMQTRFIFYVYAQDGGNPSLLTTGNVTIIITDQNDNCPTFIGPPSRYNISLNESTLEGTNILNITANDPDQGIAGSIKYRLENVAQAKQFKINEDSGMLSLMSSLDYEVQTAHDVDILAYDQGLPRNNICRQTVHIDVLNDNEYTPAFDNVLYVLTVNEGLPVDSVFANITAYDRDYNSVLTYSLTNVLPSTDAFSITTVKGSAQFKTLKELDYETQPTSYNATLTVTDEGGKQNTAEVFVLVNNLNDNQPQFDKNAYNSSISESANTGSTVITVRATDADNITNIPVTYSIVGGNTGNAFGILANEGTIYLAEQLDYETTPGYVLSIKATDTGDPPNTAVASVIVNVLNENEHAPMFTLTSYTFTLAEESPVGTVVGVVNTTDQDTGNHGNVAYHLQSPSSYFAIDSTTGIITSLVRIDREVTPTVTPIVVVATDSSKNNTATVFITISDTNDNSPQFSDTLYEFTVDVSSSIGTVVGTITANDPDLLSLTHYNINNSTIPFVVNTTTGAISVSQTLLNTNAPYQFILTAVDAHNSSLSNQTNVRIYVTSTNDHYPVFSQRTYTVEINENTLPSLSLLTVRADDPDTGSNGLIRYSFSDHSLNYQQFTIGQLSGLIDLTQALDYEDSTTHTLVVYARDSTPSHPRTATALVIVNVLNVNDNRPTFVNFPSSLTISYVPYLGINLFQLSAIDLDSSPFTFLLWSQTNKFSIDPSTGTVTNTIILNSTTTYSLEFRVTDGNHTSRTMSLHIVAPPDNAPSFQGAQPLIETVSEGASVGKLIMTFSSLNSPTSYHLVCCGDSLTTFSVDSQSGAFSVARSLDYESINSYHAVVEARKLINNTTRYSDYINVNISVTNVNEFAPQFSPVSPININENTDVDTLVTQVTATDSDSGDYGNVTYHIISGNTGNAFTINQNNGAIHVASSIDREAVPRYNLLIKAQDGGGRQSTITLHVLIQDENDTPPTFSSNYTIGIYESGSINDIVLQVSAIDPDTDTSLTYSIGNINAYHGNTHKGIVQKFSINSTTGIITLSSQVDYETVTRYEFDVSAFDSQSTAVARVTVNVLDANDHVPQFEHSSYHTSLAELLPHGSLLTTVMAFDTDSYVQSPIRYSLTNSLHSNKFFIDEYGGSIRVYEPISYIEVVDDCYGTSQFSLTAVATDGVHTVYVNVTVRIIDVNNYSPLFVDSPYNIITSEVMPIDSTLRNITVKDHDCGLNSLLSTFIPSYYFQPFNLFKLQLISGSQYQLKVKNTLPQGTYHFRLSSFNFNPSPKEVQYFKASHTDVKVTVLPNNTHGPVFDNNSAQFSVYENSNYGTNVGNITATDLDLGISGYVNYFITNTTTVPFTINNTSGTLSVNGSLDYETTIRYTLEVIATDNGYPVRTATMLVVIDILDVDDNPPLFTSTLFTGVVTENSPNDTQVLSVSVTDADSTTVVSYSIVDQNIPFRIHPTTGLITTSGVIDYETKTSYQFTVKSSDNEIFSSTLVRIDVTGINEFAPVLQRYNEVVLISDRLSKGDQVMNVTATDADKGKDGEIKYCFKPQNEYLVMLENGTIILNVNQTTTSSAPTSTRKRQTNVTTIKIETTVVAIDSGNPPLNDTTSIMFSIPNVVPVQSPVPTSTGAVTQEIIAIMSSVAGTILIVIIVVIVLISVIVSRSRRLNKAKFDLQERQNTSNVTPRVTEVPLDEENIEHVELQQLRTINDLGLYGTPVKKATSNPKISQNGVENGNFAPEPFIPSYNRSTSDLASSVATDTLNLTQENSFPYPKAQIEAIYAANADLLDNVSQASVHTFGSEGGGESVGDEFDTIYYTKYGEIDVEGSMMGGDMDDLSSKGRTSMISVTSEGGREAEVEEYHFSQSTNPWSSRRSINDLMGEGSRMMYQFEPSQGVSGYALSTTQESSTSNSLMNSQRGGGGMVRFPPSRNPIGSNRDLRHSHSKLSHGHVPRHTYDYFPPDRNTPPAPPMSLRSHHVSRRYESPPIPDFRSQISAAPPPYFSQDPAPYHSFTQGSPHGYSHSPDPLQLPYFIDRKMSNSSTSLSTSASHQYNRRRGCQ